MIAVSHPTGNRFVEALVSGLGTAGLLHHYYTTLAFPRGVPWLEWLPNSLGQQLKRRAVPLEAAHFSARPWREAVRLALTTLGSKSTSLTTHELGWASVDAIYHDMDRWVARKIAGQARVRGVYAYEDGALATFRQAAADGKARIYDLPIGYWAFGRRLMAEEAERRPDWAATLTGNLDSDEKLARKDGELELATTIVVASSFTRETLRDSRVSPTARISLVPYGAPTPCPPAILENKLKGLKGRRLRALFVGGLSQRKGIADVFAAAKLMRGAIELTIVGRRPAECRALENALKGCRYLPSLAHNEILREMRAHDVLLFPSLFEGFGLVILEAMAQGTPVITTTHTAGPDIISNGIDGLIIPIRDVNAIVNAIYSMHDDRARLEHMSHAAWHKASSFSWSQYQRDTVRIVRESLGELSGVAV